MLWKKIATEDPPTLMMPLQTMSFRLSWLSDTKHCDFVGTGEMSMEIGLVPKIWVGLRNKYDNECWCVCDCR